MPNIVLQFHLPDRVGPQAIDTQVECILKTDNQLFFKPSKLDMVWLMLRHQPTEGLFTFDPHATQVIPGMYSIVFNSKCHCMFKL